MAVTHSGSTPPKNPATGDMWLNPANNSMYVYGTTNSGKFAWISLTTGEPLDYRIPHVLVRDPDLEVLTLTSHGGYPRVESKTNMVPSDFMSMFGPTSFVRTLRNLSPGEYKQFVDEKIDQFVDSKNWTRKSPHVKRFRERAHILQPRAMRLVMWHHMSMDKTENKPFSAISIIYHTT